MFLKKRNLLILLTAMYLLAGSTKAVAVEKSVEPMVVQYQVQPGDTIDSISQYYNVDAEIVALMNGLEDQSKLREHQLLLIPNEQTIVYQVKEGDNLSGIALEYNVPVDKIIDENELSGQNGLEIGQQLAISVPLAREVISPNISRGQSFLSFLWPVDGIVSSPFGLRDGRQHQGLDIAADYGLPVKAARGGRVTFAGPRGTYGKAIIIQHAAGFYTLYAHTSKILVNTGDIVETGQEIALIGSTGRSTGPHLHFEIRRNEVPLNPIKFLPYKN